MRALSCMALVAVLAVPVSAARAQVQQNNPNAANESLARQGDMRAVQQQRVSDFNTATLQGQRNVQYRPETPDGGGIGLRRGGGRHGSVHRRGGFNSSICTGC